MSARASRSSRKSGFRSRFSFKSPFAAFSLFRRPWFASRFASLLSPRRPRAPLLRIGVGLLGLALLAVLLVFGLLIGAAMLTIGLLWRARARRNDTLAQQTGKPGAIDGEYRIVRKPTLPSPIASAR